MATVTKRFSLQSAHFLPEYKGKCANMHGHNWDIALTVEGPIDFTTGMVMDFSELKRRVIEKLVEAYDHKILNECHPFSTAVDMERPTAENLGAVIVGIAMEALKDADPVKVHSVTVWETRDNWATVYPSDFSGGQ